MRQERSKAIFDISKGQFALGLCADLKQLLSGDRIRPCNPLRDDLRE